MTPLPMTTAEWNCTTCGATNRILVVHDQAEARDRCVSCHTPHRVTRDARPVRWKATATK